MRHAGAIWILTIIAGLLLAGCPNHQQHQEETIHDEAQHGLVQLSTEANQTAGIRLVTVENREGTTEISTTGEIKADQDSVFHVSAFVGGRIIKDNVRLGDTVRQGQVLAILQNLEVAKLQANYIHELHNNEIEIEQAKTRYMLAQRNLERERLLLAEGISPRKDFQKAEAEALLAKAELEGRQEHRIHIQSEGKALLSTYGMSPSHVQSEIIRTGSPITAPHAGVITRKHITRGDTVMPDTVLYEITDLRRVWLDMPIYPQDLPQVRVGQTVHFTTDALPGQTVEGRIAYLQPDALDGKTFIARAFLDNTRFLLKPGMVGTAKILQPHTKARPFVPTEAIQRYGRETFVFIPLGNGRYRKQTIVLDGETSSGAWVKEGLQAGQTIVGDGSYTLKAVLLKHEFGGEEH